MADSTALERKVPLPDQVVAPEMEDLKKAYDTLAEKTRQYDKLFAYYDGDHPITFLTERLRRLFAGIDVNWTENWCAVVVDSVLERLLLEGFVIAEDEAGQVSSDDLFKSLKISEESEDVHEAALVTGEAYIIVGETVEDVEMTPFGEVQTYLTQVHVCWNDPRTVHAFYFKGRPNEIRYAAKWYETDDGYLAIVLYYRDRIEYWISTEKAVKVQSAKVFILDPDEPPVPNPYGIIPVFHFRNSRRTCKGELKSVIDPQSVVNKLLNDMMAAAEFAAFRQKYIISNTSFSAADLENDPGSIWDIPAGDGLTGNPQVGEFSATDLSNYSTAMDREVNVIAAITRTPKHYFEGSGDLSGEALIAMEAPLNRKAKKRLDRYTSTWQELWAFVMSLHGHEILPQDIKAKYARPETVQPLTRAQIRQTNKGAGIPTRTTLRVEEGWSEQQLRDMDDDAKAEAEVTQQTLGDAMMRLNAGSVQGR